MKTPSLKTTVILVAALLVAGLALSRLGHDPGSAVDVEVSDVASRTRELIDYSHMSLTPAQEEVKRVALSALPAPCCSNYSAYTCCCPCNMAKSIWGLSNHLIVDEEMAAEQVRAEVGGWIDAINPDGFSGDACFTGGCNRAFADNGCGGMTEAGLVLD